MVNILGLLGEAIQWLASWAPRLLVLKPSEAAVKYPCGKTSVPLGPGGLHIYWPIVTPVEKTSVVGQVLNLTEQKLVTLDNVPVLASGLCEYEVTDVVAFLAEKENAFSAIDDVATAAIERVVTSSTYDALRLGRPSIRRRLTRACQRELEPYGVHVIKARLTDFAPATVLCIAGLPASITLERSHESNS